MMIGAQFKACVKIGASRFRLKGLKDVLLGLRSIKLLYHSVQAHVLVV